MSPIISVIITAIIVLLLPGSWLSLTARTVMKARSVAQRKNTREIIDEALKVAETKKKEALLEAKEENLKSEK